MPSVKLPEGERVVKVAYHAVGGPSNYTLRTCMTFSSLFTSGEPSRGGTAGSSATPLMAGSRPSGLSSLAGIVCPSYVGCWRTSTPYPEGDNAGRLS